MSLNFITVCTNDYPIYYAEKITNQFKRLTKLSANYFCITDRPTEVKEWAIPIQPPKLSRGWWNKVNLFSPEMPEGWLLYMDLDIVIKENFDDEVYNTIEKGKDINCVSDAIGWMGIRFSSSLMLIKSGSRADIYAKFEEFEHELVDRPGGDQVWIGPMLQDVYFMDEDYPNLKKNLKFHIAHRQGQKLTLPVSIPKEIKLIDCGGRPKPHELGALNYIKENWHDVPPLV